MGRKAKFDKEGQVVKRGPGKKTKKQKDPVFPKSLINSKLVVSSDYLIFMFFIF